MSYDLYEADNLITFIQFKMFSSMIQLIFFQITIVINIFQHLNKND